MLYTYIVKYKKVGNNKELLGKLEASCWTEAIQKAKNTIKFIEERLNENLELIDVVNLETIEKWDF